VAAWQAALERYYAARCAFMFRCAAELGTITTSQEACRDYWSTSFDASYLSAYGVTSAGASSLSFAVPTAAAIAECDQGWAQAPCTPIGEGEAANACGGLAVALRTAVAGAPCGILNDPRTYSGCEEGLDCVPNAPSYLCFTCAPARVRHPVGAACGDALDCSSYYCVPGDGGSHCAAYPYPAELGAPCGQGSCYGMACIGSGGAGVCGQRASVGEPCADQTQGDPAPLPPCLLDLGCFPSADAGYRCVASVPFGQPCKRETDPSGAPCLGVCLFDSELSQTGTCVASEPVVAEDGPCNNIQMRYGAYQFNGLNCGWTKGLHAEFYTAPDAGIAFGCSCRRPSANCGVCYQDSDCASGRCLPTTDRPGFSACADTLPNGSTCTGPQDCTSHTCNPDHVCVAAPTCP
jgi:hypothetical protein